MTIVKTITYENLEEKHKENPKILPFKYIKPFKQEIEEIEEKEASAPNGPPFMWEEFLQEKKNGFKGSYQDYLDVIDRSPLDYAKKKEGIMQMASVEDDMDREFYGRLLSPLYRPDYLESLPIPMLKELFEEYLRNMGIG